MQVYDNSYTVYIHINKSNNKCYIGMTKVDTNQRWGKDGIKYFGQVFYNAIEKYGWNDFEHIIVFENKTQEEAEYLERLFIKVLLSNNRIYGYNIENGGNSVGTMSEETKEKISKSKIGKTKKVVCDNKIFNKVSECSEYYFVGESTMRKWLTGFSKMPQRFIDMGLKYLEEDLNKNNKSRIPKKCVACGGLIFKSISECAKYYKINYVTMRSWLYGKYIMPYEFMTLNLRFLDEDKNMKLKFKKVVCNNVVYNKISDCAKFYGIDRSKMSNWLNGKHKMPKEYIDLGLRFLTEEDLNAYRSDIVLS